MGGFSLSSVAVPTHSVPWTWRAAAARGRWRHRFGSHGGRAPPPPRGPILPPVDAPRRRFRLRRRPVRVYMDGCFDMMHYGHCNALRQARALGDELVVGVVSDDEITANKGPPVTALNERMIMVCAVKWVDDVIPDAPYAITEDFMNNLFNKYNVDYIIHADDPCLLPDGTDAYYLAKRAGRYKQIKRTEGVSTTDIVGSMLLCVRESFF